MPKKAPVSKTFDSKVLEVAVLEISQALCATLDLTRVVNLSLDLLEQLLLYESAAFLVAENETEFKTIAFRNLNAEKSNWFSKKFIHHVTSRVLKERAPLVIPAPGKYGAAYFKNTQALALMPAFFEGKLIGLICAESSTAGAFSHLNLRTLALLSNQIALALKNAQAYKELETLSITDGLTKLVNYRYFQDRLVTEIKRADRYHTIFTYVMMDIDHFKKCNDTFGHIQGDRVLQEMAKTLKSNFRETDIVARYGGEEFAILLPETNLSGAYLAAERCRKLIYQTSFAWLRKKGGQNVRFTISGGVAEYPVHASTKEGIIRAADNSLYEAKKLGRNRIISADEVL